MPLKSLAYPKSPRTRADGRFALAPIDGGVLRANAQDSVIDFLAMRQGIPAEDIDVVGLDQIGADSFKADRRIRISLGKQETHTLAENGDARMFRLRRFADSVYELPEPCGKANRVRSAVDHDGRESVGRVQ